jgi:hypothetical protein
VRIDVIRPGVHLQRCLPAIFRPPSEIQLAGRRHDIFSANDAFTRSWFALGEVCRERVSVAGAEQNQRPASTVTHRRETLLPEGIDSSLCIGTEDI